MAAAGFQALVTVDKNLRHQQNIPGSGVGVIVLKARTNRPEHLAPLFPQVRKALVSIRPGEVIEISVL